MSDADPTIPATPSTVLITGGAGFIGSNVARRLLAADGAREVRVIDDLSTGSADNLDGLDAVAFHKGSINDEAVLDVAMDGVDAVIHLAARPSVPRSIADPVASHLANATGTLAVLEAARRHGSPHVIVASSSSVYGGNPTLPKSEDLSVQPLSPYAVSKLATEQYALAYGHCYDLPVLAVRFFNVYGPGQAPGHAYAAVVPSFLDAALRGEPVPVHGDGGQTRDFTFVGTVADTLIRAVDEQITSTQPVNLAFGSRSSLLEVIAEIEDLLGHPVERTHSEPRAGDVRHSQADQTRFAALFPDQPAVSLREGLQATIDWFRSR